MLKFLGFLLIFSLPGVFLYIRPTSEILEAFERFIIKFNKTYANQAIRDQALQIFASEFVSIKDHNAEYVAKKVSFGRRINQLSDITLANKIKGLNGFRLSRPRSSSSPSASPSLSRFPNFNDYEDNSSSSTPNLNPLLPSSSSNRKKRQALTFPPGPPELDWRKFGAVNTPIDQGYSCLSCWAFAATGALEAQYFFLTGTLAKFSEQNLVDCNLHSVTGNWGCDVSHEG